MHNELEVVATGKKWLGQGVRATASVIKEMIDTTENSLLITAFILSDVNVYTHIVKALDRGVSVDIFINSQEKNLSRFMDNIIDLGEEYVNMNVFKVNNVVFHSKVLVSDGEQVLIGSANFTKSGLLTNYELGVLIKNPAIAYEIEMVIRRFFE